MRRYFVLLFLLTVFIMSSSAAQAETIVVTLKDGRQVIGELVDYRAGKYLVRTEKELVEIAEGEILTVDYPESPSYGGGEAPRVTPDVRPAVSTEKHPEWEFMRPSPVPEAQMAFEEGRFLQEQGFVDESMDFSRKAFELDPWFLPARLAYAIAALEVDKLDLALAQVEKILEVDAKNIHALRVKAEARRKGGYTNDALKVEAQIIDVTFPHPQNLYEKAHLWIKNGKNEEGVLAWQEYLKADPEQQGEFNKEASAIRDAEIAVRKGDFGRALSRFYEAVKVNPLLRARILERVAAVHRDRANGCYAQGNPEKGIPDLEALKGLTPEKRESLDAEIFEVHRAVLNKWINVGKFDETSARLKNLGKEMESAKFRALLGEAVAYAHENARRHAFRPGFRELVTAMQQIGSELRDAEVLLGVVGKAWYEIANAEATKAVWDKAIDDYSRAASLNPELKEVIDPAIVAMRFDYAKTLMEQKEYAEAIAHLEMVFELEPEHEEAGSLLDVARFENMRKRVEAQEALGKKIEIVGVTIPQLSGEQRVRAGIILEELEREKQRVYEIERVRRETLAYHPVREGVWWKYKNPSGEMIEQRKIEAVRWDGENLVAKIAHTSMLMDHARPLKYQLVNDGRDLFYVRPDGEEKDREYLFRFPIEVGKTWSWTRGEVVYSRRYLSATERVATPLGTFTNCLKVEFKSAYNYGEREEPYEIVIYNYFAPGVGLVKSDMVGDDFYDLELIEYDVPEEKESIGVAQ